MKSYSTYATPRMDLVELYLEFDTPFISDFILPRRYVFGEGNNWPETGLEIAITEEQRRSAVRENETGDDFGIECDCIKTLVNRMGLSRETRTFKQMMTGATQRMERANSTWEEDDADISVQIREACKRVALQGRGEANTLIVNPAMLENVLRNISARIAVGCPGSMSEAELRDGLQSAFRLKYLAVAQAVAKLGGKIERVWPKNRVAVLRVGSQNPFSEDRECYGVTRTYVDLPSVAKAIEVTSRYDPYGPYRDRALIVEQYREEVTKSEIYRASERISETIFDPRLCCIIETGDHANTSYALTDEPIKRRPMRPKY